MKYRRHGGNVTSGTYYKTSVPHLIRRVFEPNELAKAHSIVYNHSLVTISLLKRLPLSDEQVIMLDEIEDCLRSGGLKAEVYFKRHHIRFGRFSEDVGRKMILLLKLHKKYLLENIE